MGAPLYVETEVRAPMEELWRLTQDAAQHQRWDLRFTEIRPLPDQAGDPQRFGYVTRVLPFLRVSGEGAHAGERRRPDGSATSALRFASDHPLSLIEEGSGYWRYVPGSGHVRFLTGYDYQPRWGRLGRVLDTAVFRPLMGWATAWSFDRLRIWLELGITPERSRDLAVLQLGLRLAAAVTALAFHPAVGVAALVLVALAPPARTIPAARRCRRTPPAGTRAPRVTTTLATEGTR